MVLRRLILLAGNHVSALAVLLLLRVYRAPLAPISDVTLRFLQTTQYRDAIATADAFS